MKTEPFLIRALRFLRNNAPVRTYWKPNLYLFNPSRDFPEKQIKFIGYIPQGKVLDIGSGNRPFPYANQLIDKLYYDKKQNYTGKAKILEGQQMHYDVDVQDMRIFPDKEFDFVFCSHVLEHVEDPIKACKEIIRIGKKGFIETPRIGTDALFSWDSDSHLWLVHSVGNTLIFFPNTDLLRQGINSTAFRDMISSPFCSPLQEAFFNNHEVFNVMFNWIDNFNVVVFNTNGTFQAYGSVQAEVRK